jgi:hypothetical protein
VVFDEIYHIAGDLIDAVPRFHIARATG